MPKEWLEAPGSSCNDKCEEFALAIMFYFPVIVAFGLYIVLVAFYITCFLIPCLLGDFAGTLGIVDYWANSSERDADRLAA